MSFICMRIENYFHLRRNHIAHHTLFTPAPFPKKKKTERKKQIKKNYLSIVFAFSWNDCYTQR